MVNDCRYNRRNRKGTMALLDFAAYDRQSLVPHHRCPDGDVERVDGVARHGVTRLWISSCHDGEPTADYPRRIVPALLVRRFITPGCTSD